MDWLQDQTTAVAYAFASLVIGLLLGRHTASSPQDEALPEQAPHRPAEPAPKVVPVPWEYSDMWASLERISQTDLSEFPALFEEFRTTLYGTDRRWAMENLLLRWSELDATGAVAYVKQLGEADDSLKSVFYADWARRDFESAMSAALQDKPFQSIGRETIKGLSASYPEKCLQWQQSEDAVGLKQKGWEDLFAALPVGMMRHPVDVLASIHPNRRKIARYAMARYWIRTNPSKATEWLESLTDDWKQASRAMLGEWMVIDPNSALSYADAQGIDLADMSIISPSEGVSPAAMAAALESSTTKPDAVERFAANTARFDLAYVTELAAHLKSPALSKAVTDIVVSELLRNQPIKAAEWISSLPDQLQASTREKFKETLTERHSPPDLLPIIDHIPEDLLPEDARTGAMLYQQALTGDLVPLIDWIKESSERTRDTYMVFKALDRQAPHLSEAYLSRFSPDEIDSLGINRIAEKTLESPLNTIEWANSIEDPDHRDGWTFVVINRWMLDDSTSALSWIDQIEEPILRGNAILSATKAWIDFDPRSAIRYALQTQDQEARDVVLPGFFETAYQHRGTLMEELEVMNLSTAEITLIFSPKEVERP